MPDATGATVTRTAVDEAGATGMIPWSAGCAPFSAAHLMTIDNGQLTTDQ